MNSTFPRFALLLAISLLVFASLPWLISSCSSEPLLPEDIRQAPVYYESTAEASRSATMEAQRQEPGTRKLIVVGTVSPRDETLATTSTPEPVESSAIVTDNATIPIPATVSIESPSPGLGTSSTIVIKSTQVVTTPNTLTSTTAPSATVTTPLSTTAPLTPTAAVTRVVITASGTEPDRPDSAGGSSTPSAGMPGRPGGLVKTIDMISPEMMADQVVKDAVDVRLSDVDITFTEEGFNATATATALTRKMPVELHGSFAVTNSNLVVEIAHLRVDGRDMTAQYGNMVEDRINSGLYRLLPQRYVDAYVVEFGQLLVQSMARP